MKSITLVELFLAISSELKLMLAITEGTDLDLATLGQVKSVEKNEIFYAKGLYQN